jgi:hypothetical protein
MRLPARSLSALAVASLMAFPALAEDLTVVYKTTGPDGEGTSTQYFSAERMRSKEKDHDTVFEYSTGTIWSIDHQKKQYSQMTLAEMEQAMEAAAAEMKKMQAQMESMPDAVKKQMEKMMGGLAGEVTVTKGGTKEVAGYPTQEYKVTMGDAFDMSLWNTTKLSLPVPEMDLRKLASFTGPMAALSQNPMFKGFGQLAEKMKEIEGFTLASSTSFKMMGRGIDSSREAVEVKTGPIPAGELDVATIAPGYKKVDSPMLKMGKR